MNLNDRIKAATKAPRVSMVPDFSPPPAKEEKEVPDARELISDAKLRIKLAQLCAEHVEWGQAESAAKKAKKPLTEKIKAILGQYKVSKVMIGDVRASYYNAPRSSLSKELLLANGVSPAVIAKCTVTKDAYTLKLTGPGEEGEEDE